MFVAETKTKGDLGVAMIMADVLKRGYKVAIPVGEDWDYDLIVLWNGELERVQVKYTESDGKVIHVPCRSRNNWSVKKYTQKMIDWIAVYDKTTDKCYYLPSSLLGNGRVWINLRLTEPANNQKFGINWAEDFLNW